MRRAFSPVLLATQALAVVALFAASDARADDIIVDLKGGASPASLSPTGIPGPGTVFWEAEGLRIKLAADRKPLDPIGMRTRFAVSGDFEVTAACDLNQAEPKSGYLGSGARLFVKFDSPKGEMASLSRVRRERGGDVYLAFLVWKEAGIQKEIANQIPAKSKTGWLRLRREGDRLFFEAADDGKEYRAVQDVPIGAGDMQEVALTATTNGHPSATEIRWKEFRIMADGLGTKPTLPTKPSRFWFYVLCGVVAVVVVAIPVGIAIRKKR